MSRIQDYLRKGADLIDLAISSLEVISHLTKNVADDKAVDVVKMVAAIVAEVRSGFSGKTSPSEAMAILDHFKQDLQDSDAAALAALKKKFHKP